MDLFTDTNMDGLAPAEQAERAIFKTLSRIHNEPFIAWYLGMGSQTFSLLTEAYAALTGKTVQEVRQTFRPLDARNPATQEQEE